MIVVDVGCAPRAGDESIHKLIRRFAPDLIYGFDPGAREAGYWHHGCFVNIRPRAAWTYDGGVWYVERGNDGIESYVVEERSRGLNDVTCFDLAQFIIDLGQSVDDEIILKMDCEGGEYVLIPHLVETGAIHLVSKLLVEFHGDQERPVIPIPWEPW